MQGRENKLNNFYADFLTISHMASCLAVEVWIMANAFGGGPDPGGS